MCLKYAWICLNNAECDWICQHIPGKCWICWTVLNMPEFWTNYWAVIETYIQNTDKHLRWSVLQYRCPTSNFQVREGRFVELGCFDKDFVKNTGKRDPAVKYFEVFFSRYSQNYISNGKFNSKMDKMRAFLSKIRMFFNFQPSRGGLPCQPFKCETTEIKLAKNIKKKEFSHNVIFYQILMLFKFLKILRWWCSAASLFVYM